MKVLSIFYQSIAHDWEEISASRVRGEFANAPPHTAIDFCPYLTPSGGAAVTRPPTSSAVILPALTFSHLQSTALDEAP